MSNTDSSEIKNNERGNDLRGIITLVTSYSCITKLMCNVLQTVPDLVRTELKMYYYYLMTENSMLDEVVLIFL